MRNRLGRAFYVVIVLLLQVGVAYGQSLQSFLEQAEKAVNTAQISELTALAQPGHNVDFSWVDDAPTAFLAPQPWKAYVLEAPAVGQHAATRYIAFSRYHIVQSNADHLYPLISDATGLHIGEEQPETETLGYRITKHRLNVHFDIKSKSVSITDHVTIERTANTDHCLLLRLNTIYHVSSVKQADKDIAHTQAPGFIALPAQSEARADYDLAYSATLEGSDEDYMKADEAAVTAYWYPTIARLPAASDVSATVPKGWIALGQGEFVSRTETDGETTYSFTNPLPVCYQTVVAAPFHVTTKTVNGVEVSAYLLKADDAHANKAIATASKAIAFYSKRFCPFPFKRYAVVESNTFPAALECYSFTLVNRSMIPAAISHELSHTWWGGILPNSYTRCMWNESFAVYSDGLFGDVDHGLSMHDSNMFNALSAVSSVNHNITLAKAHNALSNLDAAVGYGKGAMVLENLGRLLGDAKMQACVRRFIAQRVPGNDNHWDDFVSAVVHEAGPQWAAYFPPWISRSELPSVRLKDVRCTQSASKWVVQGTVSQATPDFWISLPIELQVGDHKVNHLVVLKGASASFRVETREKPTKVSIDPSQMVLRARSTASQAPQLGLAQLSSGPLLVIYATGGSTAENAAVKRVATTLVTGLFSLASVTVMPDKQATRDMVDTANVLMLGKPQHLRLGFKWSEQCPLVVSDNELGWANKRWHGEDLWALALTRHPKRPDGFVAWAAGVGVSAILNFDRQSELPMERGRFVVRGAGKLVASEECEAPDASVVVLE